MGKNKRHEPMLCFYIYGDDEMVMVSFPPYQTRKQNFRSNWLCKGTSLFLWRLPCLSGGYFLCDTGLFFAVVW